MQKIMTVTTDIHLRRKQRKEAQKEYKAVSEVIRNRNLSDVTKTQLRGYRAQVKKRENDLR